LTGCVADADDMRDFLVATMGTSPLDMINLRDGQATRETIISSLRSLKIDERIQHGDPIVIYFAGHGSTCQAPSGWSVSGRDIEMLLPHDFDCTDQRDGAQGIFDQTFSSLIAEIARVKGDNITVILDSCHSGSSTRSNAFGVQVRGFDLPADYRARLCVDENIYGTYRGILNASSYEKSGLASHVLLAASSANGPARETGGRGVFTVAFLSLLRNPDTDLQTLTYLDIIDRIPDLPEYVTFNIF
jgi:hypothetical protein